MSRKDFFSDIDCPQFVDFVAGLGQEDDAFFEQQNGENFSPASAHFNQPVVARVSTKYKERTKRMTLAIEENPADHNTLELSNEELKDKLARSPCVNMERPSTLKTNRRRSRSEGSIPVKPKIGFCLPNLRRISVSSNNVNVKKKTKCPGTPMCLKRPKTGKQIKSSEQIELEKIAEMQKQLSARLRQNEMSLKRLGLKKKAQPPNHEVALKGACFIKPAEPPRELEPVRRGIISENLKKLDEEIRSKFRHSKATCLAVPRIFGKEDIRNLSQHSASSLSSMPCSSKTDVENMKGAKVQPPNDEVALKGACFIKPAEPPREVEPVRKGIISENLKKLDEEIRSKFRHSKAPHGRVVPRILLKEIPHQKDVRNFSQHSSLNVSSVSCSSKSDAENNELPLGVKNVGFHSGIPFNLNKKITAVKPFTFDTSKEKTSKTENVSLNQPCLPNAQNDSIRSVKENIPTKINKNVGKLQKK